jgi:adenine-specific DNA-methyltransferase
MKLATQTPKKVLKAFLKQKPLRSEIDLFKTHLIALLDKMKTIDRQPKDESEEHLKNDLRDFLRDTYYRDTHSINTKDKKDLVVHLSKGTDSEVGVIIEAKRPNNTSEMVTADNPNKKALHELILYYFDERNEADNNQLKHLIVTNVQEWYILDANLFDKHIYRNTQLKKLYDTKRNDKKDNPWFYEEVGKVIAKMDVELPCTYFDIREYDTILRNNKKEDDRELSALYKILAPQHLLKIASPNDSNALNEKFYKELLHLIGLEEAKEGGKNIIRRKKDGKNPASLIELTVDALLTEDVLHRLPDASTYGTGKEERAFNVALELCITWINRILFLKLLEGQLVSYHQGNRDHRFLNLGMINDFDELFKLFHKVLAVNVQDRTAAIQHKYGRVPYLNSSLFEISELEDQTIKINSLDNGLLLDLIGTSILKDARKKTDRLPTLDYLFQFLDAYDFASEGTEDVQEENKSIINASVLGKVFEKINGYKDGSIFTPAFITMYMCRQSIRLAVVEKFNESLGGGTFDKYEDLKNYTARLFKTTDILQANEVINGLRICDPAVGSGHFLVSSLNEIICIKAELGILADKEGNSIRGYEIEIVNDELIITDPRNKDSTLEYKMSDGKPLNKEMQRLQKLLFHEKQTVIENCLFGVDINPNSVKICRLRLWIELLKNAYYREEDNFTELETLPNIDINIKCGNSLLSRFALDADLSKALKSIKYDIKAYRGFVQDYKNEKSREVKRGLQRIIDGIKTDFRTEIGKNDPKQLRLYKLGGELYNLVQPQMFELSAKEKKANQEKQAKLEADIQKLSSEIEEIKNNAVYKNAFEWRFEFPEVLNNDGDFEGFDIVIGNPPYIRVQDLQHSLIDSYKDKFKVAHKRIDISILFIELGHKILKTNGLQTYITSNQFLKAEYGRNVRAFLKGHLKVNIDYSKVSVFDGLATYVSVFLISKNQNKAIDYKLMENAEDVPQGFIQFETSTFSDEPWDFNINQSLKQKVFNDKNTLNEISNFTYGVITGLDKAFLIPLDQIKELNLEKEITKNFIRPQNYKKYHISSQTFSLIFPYNKDNTIIEEAKLKNKFPNCFKFLSRFKTELENRQDSRTTIKEKGVAWYSLMRRVDLDDIDTEKIIFYDVGMLPNFILDNNNFIFGGGTSHSLRLTDTSYDVRFILGVLNSALMTWVIYDLCPVKMGNARKYGLDYIKKLPIPKNVDEKIKNSIIQFVDKILEAKQQGEDSSDIEKKIDELVYKLYDITADEQKIIEGK